MTFNYNQKIKYLSLRLYENVEKAMYAPKKGKSLSTCMSLNIIDFE